jgi:ferric-dicitrate binding protein FerR (iron transport regulator)
MKPQRIRSLSFLCAVLCIAAAPGTTNEQEAAQASTAPIAGATVTDFKGNVQVELPGKAASNPTLGQVLPAETTITTGKGRILLQLEDGSQVLVHANTRLVLKQPSPSNWQRLQLLLGKIKAEIQKRTGGSPPFQIGTPSAVITVRGTRFYVEVDKHKSTRVKVEEGVVEVQNLKGTGKPVLIKAGFSTRVDEDSAPESPKESPGHERQQNRDNGLGGMNHGSPGSRGKKP